MVRKFILNKLNLNKSSLIRAGNYSEERTSSQKFQGDVDDERGL